MPSRNLNRILWFIVLCAVAYFGLAARDSIELYFAGVGKLDVTIDNGTARLSWRGKIDAPMAARIAEAYEAHAGNVHTFSLSLSSPGGSVEHGGQVVRLLQRIREGHTLETLVESRRRCASMCVPVYLQGTRRRAAPNAQFMFHQVSFREPFTNEEVGVPETAARSATDRFFDRYFLPAGVPAAWIAAVRTAMEGGGDVWKSAEELVAENAAIVQDLN